MTGTTRYMAAAAALVALAVALCWALLGAPAGVTTLAAGVAALGIQAGLFVLLQAAHGDHLRFMKLWVAGMLVRFGCIGVAGAVASLYSVPEPAVTVLSTAGFLFALHLLETAFLGGHASSGYAR
jgi:hypothetical protein